MSDADVTAVLSYLRSRNPVKSDHPSTSWNFLGRALWAMGFIHPDGPTEEIPRYVSPDTTANYGRYLANSISNCKGCHTSRDMKTGAFTSPVFSGGFEMPSEFHAGRVYITPNITPDPTTGWIRNWSEKQFIERLHKGRIYDDSPMPWTSFKNFSDNDLKAIFRYLATLKPIQRDNGATVREAQ
jgi:mono/diheme cytochrome c family protein